MINKYLSDSPRSSLPANDISVEQITDLAEQLGEILYTGKSLIEFVKELKSSAGLSDDEGAFIIEMFGAFSEFDDKNDRKIYDEMQCRYYYNQIETKLVDKNSITIKVDFTKFKTLFSFKGREGKNFTEDVFQKFKDLLQGEIGGYTKQNNGKIAVQKIVGETSEFAESLIIERRVS